MAGRGAAGGLARGLESGLNIGMRAIDMQRKVDESADDKRYRDRALRLKEMEFELEKGAGDLFGQILKAEQEETRSRGQASQVMTTMFDTAKKPKSMRDVDTLAAVLKDQSGIELAPNAVDVFKKASTEELLPIMNAAANQFVDDPDQNMQTLGKVLSNPMAFNQMLSTLNNSALAAEQGKEIGKEPPRASEEDKRSKLVAQLERRRDAYMKVADGFPTTKHGQAAFLRAKEMQDRIDKISPSNKEQNIALRVAATAAGVPNSTSLDQLTPEQAKATNDAYKSIVMAQTVGNNGEIINVPLTRSQVGAFAGTPKAPLKPLPKDAQETINAVPGMYRAMDTIEKHVSKSGRVKGIGSKVGAFFGTDKDAIDFNTARSNLRVQGQAIIKGIPSNYDIQSFMETVPNLLAPDVANESRIKFTREVLDDTLKGTISFYQGTGYKIPQFVADLAKKRGIDLNDIKPWNGDTNNYPLDDVYRKHEAQIKKLSAEKAGGSVPKGMTKAKALKMILDANPGAKASDPDVQELLRKRGF